MENRVRRFGFGIAVLVLLAGLVVLPAALATQGLDRANTWASLFGGYLAIILALVNLVNWWWKRHPDGDPLTSEQLARAATDLHGAASRQWRKEAEARSLGDPDPMPVRWRLSSLELMDHDEHIASGPLRFSGRSDQISALTEQFLRLRRRRLVIVGGPGAGKTTLAVQLLLHLLEVWQPSDSVPVLLSLASWDPHAQPRVQDWLAGQLFQTYPALRAFGADTAQRLADRGQVLPVLDGLDEMPARRRLEVIKALNASLPRDTGVILTSRTTEYTEAVHAHDVLTAAAVIEPEPLTPTEAARYLRGRLPRRLSESWKAVLTALDNGTAGPLAQVLASPLGLWLLSTVHIDGRRDPQPLIEPDKYADADAIEHHLLDELIPATIRSRRPSTGNQAPLRPHRDHDPDHVRRWLTFLARHLDKRSTRDLAWWQLIDAVPRSISGISVGLTVGLVFGLAGVIGGLAAPGTRAHLEDGLGLGPLFGLATGLSYCLSKRPQPLRAEMRFRGTLAPFLRRFVAGLAMGVGVGLGAGLPPVGVLVAGVAFGVALAVPVWLDIPADVATVPSPGVVLKQDRTAAFSFGLVIALPFGLAGGLVIGFPSGLAFGALSGVAAIAVGVIVGGVAGGVMGGRAYGYLGGGLFALCGAVVGGLVFYATDPTHTYALVGVAYGATFGFAVGCVGVLSRAWGGYTVSRCLLTLRGRLPWRLAGFLDDAYRLGLLRIVGPVYQFRHAALHNHLATTGQQTPTAHL
ncbi:MAG TPA: NACHT domain-containing protein [Pseudonocardiaceae bacterium]